MPWWPFTPHRSDDEIAKYVAAEVKAGRIPLELARGCEQALRDEADGKCLVMRNPRIKKRPPKRPSWG
jgi:hypothetical protein